MGNCKSYCCTDSEENKTEMKMDSHQPVPGQNSRRDYKNRRRQQTTTRKVYSEEEMTDKLLKDNIRSIIKLQAIWRGNIARKQFKIMKTQIRDGSRYFKMDESRETLSKVKFDPSQPREKRDKHHYKTGATYEGEWRGGFRDGFGIQTWPDGASYEGDWLYNRAHGKGKFIHVDGDVYEGDWANDKANGRGIYRHQNGATYDGDWKEDLQHGKGVEKWNDGSIYDGEYFNGKKHGFGIYIWNDQSKFIGQWVENKISGIGIYSWLDGRMYKGEWKDNNMEGYGEYVWKDGRKYEGQYKEDKKHGYGIYYWADGRKYEGYWAQGKQHGLGRYVIPQEKKERYGLWEDGKRVEWFDDEKIHNINNHDEDYKIYFRKEDSSNHCDEYASFQKPNRFHKKIDSVLTKINNLMDKFEKDIKNYGIFASAENPE
ncbi:unnamed protein product [Moneuplotes crassus]|uniref:MORN repeat protein n=1 Tax=Euplotes crassus TaxID=5936 RepID=A0AAD1X8G3_EUPCR|nr:unnamed protein product [Moneuplotes crassus]